jgi:hypothetical protein
MFLKARSLGMLLGVIALASTPAMAHLVDTATLSPGCSSYTMTLTASKLTPGATYTISWAVLGLGPWFYDSTTFTPSSTTFNSGPITKSIGPLTGSFKPFGIAALHGSNIRLITVSPASINCPDTTPPWTANTTSHAVFNRWPIQEGTFIWFNANLTASGIPSSGATIFFQDSSIHFTADQTYTVPVPVAEITFSPDVTCASTTFDGKKWITTVPLSGSDEIFLSGVAFPVPVSFSKVGGWVLPPVTWHGAFSSTAASAKIKWKWGAAVYTNFSTNYNLVGVKPTHSTACLYNNSDHAGTPENLKSYVIRGARGGGGSNWTGFWSATHTAQPKSSVGLAGYWKLDELSGTTAADSSGQGNNGTLINQPVWHPTDGAIPGALSFDGVSFQTVDIAGSVAYATQNAPFSFSAWFNLTDFSHFVPDIMQIKSDTISPWHVLLSNNSSFLGISAGSGDGTWATIKTDNVPSLGDWHHVVVTYNGNGAGTVANFQIFLDGAPQPVSPAGSYDYQSQQSRIGGDEGSENQWKGLLRDVRIYNRVLSVQEIVQLYSGT